MAGGEGVGLVDRIDIKGNNNIQVMNMNCRIRDR
jgi:hypothetical protein